MIACGRTNKKANYRKRDSICADAVYFGGKLLVKKFQFAFFVTSDGPSSLRHSSSTLFNTVSSVERGGNGN